MNKKLIALSLVLVAAMGAGCTDAERASWGALGEESDIKCYSGGVEVFSDTSTGKVLAAEGIIYRSKTTGKYVRAYADCVTISK